MSAADPDQSEDQDEVDAIAEEFAERLRKGEHPRITDYLQRHQSHAASLADLLPTIEGLERMRNQRDGKAPKTLGAYKIIREIGRGGMGVVYEAEEAGLERRVAIKVLPPAVTLDDIALKRFQREARLAARLVHPNIIPIHAFGQEGGSPYFAMHLVDGVGLDHLIDELASGARPTASGDPLTALVRELRDGGARRAGKVVARTRSFRVAVANVIAQAADALAFAHAEGVLHRDVKPSNLILDTNGRLWVSDFGLAVAESDNRLTTSGNVSGTLAYMAPERFDGVQDARSDIYGLGLSLFEMLALRPAFSAGSATDLFAAVISGRIPHLKDCDPEAPEALARIVARATARDPKDRYPDAAELARDLRDTVTNQGAPTAATVTARPKPAGPADDGSSPTLRDTPSPKRKTIPPGERRVEPAFPATATPATGLQPKAKESRTWLIAGLAAAALVLLAIGTSFLVGSTPPPATPVTEKPAPPVAPTTALTPPPIAITVAATPPATAAITAAITEPAATGAAATPPPVATADPAPLPPSIPAAATPAIPDPPPVAKIPEPAPAASESAPATPTPPVAATAAIPTPPIAATTPAPGPLAQKPDPAKPTAKKPKPGKKPKPSTDDNPAAPTWKPGDPPPGAPPGWTPPGAPPGWKPGDPVPPPPNAPPGWKPGDPLPPPPNAPPGWKPGDPPPGAPPGSLPGWTPWGGNPQQPQQPPQPQGPPR